MKIKYFLIAVLVLTFTSSFAQKKYTLSGYVKDEASGETMIGATVQADNQVTMTNAYGFYSISLTEGTHTITIMYAGYQDKVITENLTENKSLNISISENTQEISEAAIITSVRKDANVTNTQMGTVTITTEKLKKLPVVFGEPDILKAIQLMPGVQSSGEGQTGFYVRGGGPDQNMVLLDDAVVYNTGHLFGFFSVFNADAIKSATLIKGGMPAQYGGRLSSVLDVSMKDGNNKEYHADGGIGLIASRLTLEGPIVKEKGSFILSGRRTYIDVISKPFLNKNAQGSGYFFYDANLKANYSFGSKDKIFLSGYFGRDVFKFKSKDSDFKLNMPWGNATATLRWNHIFSGKLFMNVTGVYNDYNFEFAGGQTNLFFKMASGIQDWNGKVDFDYYSDFGHQFKFGGVYTYHTFTPNQISGRTEDVAFNPQTLVEKYGHEMGLYVADEFELGDIVKVNAGLRYSWFGQVGPYTGYTFTGNYITDTTYYKSGELVKNYGGLEPRLNLRFQLSPSSSIKAGITKTYQYIHLVANNGSTFPTDIWVPSTQIVQPQKSWQYSLGYFQNLLDNNIETSVEIYYKDLKNQIEYRSGYTPTVVRDTELDFVFGKGYAYGAEFFVNKTKGKFTGWVGYTLAWTWREFKDLNQGERFPAKYDRRHDLSVVLAYEPNKKWTFSTVFVYGTGNAITLPTSMYFIDQTLVQDFSKINQYRIFPYHRLDLSAIWTPNPDSQKRWKSNWAFSIYNVYNRYNPYIIYVDASGSVSQGSEIKVKQISIFPILPSITYNFKW